MATQKKKKDGRGGARKGAGRKPKMEEARIKQLVSPHLPSAIETVVEIMTKETAKNSDRLTAARLLIEYGYGKPKQSVDVTTDGESLNKPLTKAEIEKTRKKFDKEI